MKKYLVMFAEGGWLCECDTKKEAQARINEYVQRPDIADNPEVILFIVKTYGRVYHNV